MKFLPHFEAKLEYLVHRLALEPTPARSAGRYKHGAAADRRHARPGDGGWALSQETLRENGDGRHAQLFDQDNLIRLSPREGAKAAKRRAGGKA